MTGKCCICGKGFDPTGWCLHENGLAHHLSCTLTPEMEEIMLTATQTGKQQ